MVALQKALDSQASPAELAARIADVKAARARQQAELEKAQTELRQILTTRQEAIAASMGLL